MQFKSTPIEAAGGAASLCMRASTPVLPNKKFNATDFLRVSIQVLPLHEEPRASNFEMCEAPCSMLHPPTPPTRADCRL